MGKSEPFDKTLLLHFDPRQGILVTSTLTLEIVSPGEEKKRKVTFEASDLPIAIGSASDCKVILADPYVSKLHCELFCESGKIFVRDLKSTNGTKINQVQIKEAAPLNSKDEIYLGKTTILFSIQRKSEKIGEIPVASLSEFEGMITNDPKMHQIFRLIHKIAPSKETVLITGETGTGKELVARAIHQKSGVRGPFIPLNCSAIAPELIESELFGHIRGAFTGAEKTRMGAFELASHGTLFLDEIAELPYSLQSKLLRALEYKEIRPVGGDAAKKVDLRIVAATHKDLKEEARLNSFREDLFYRLYVLHIHLPPLRERKEDIPLLAKKFAQQIQPDVELAERALQKLQNHAWPGNIRELQHVIKRTLLMSEGEKIDILHWKFFDYAEKIEPLGENATLDEIEHYYLLRALRKCNWNKREAARMLGVANSTFHDKIKRHALK
ncbi:MAG: sigma 54-interacting transcriptional regulator [Deltaproteobacteria bacterium]|nr:sigma 54-interacting transcriptional regulator [Deltaproteobacteria bacterium]